MSPKAAAPAAKAPAMKVQDCRTTPFDPRILVNAVESGHLVQYSAPGGLPGTYQGEALIVLGR